jgi:hypothetical protein
MTCTFVRLVILASRVSNYSGHLSGETYLELWSTVQPSGIYVMLFGLKYIFRACATVFGSLLTLRKKASFKLLFEERITLKYCK